LAALALYILSARLIERRTPDELGLAQLAPELAAGIVLGVALFSTIMVVLLATDVYAMTGPTAAAPWQALMDSLEGAVEEANVNGVRCQLLGRFKTKAAYSDKRRHQISTGFDQVCRSE